MRVTRQSNVGKSSAIILLALTAVKADVPRLIHYQGKLRSADGAAVSGAVSLRFQIYDGATSQTPALLDETYPTVAVTNGLFNVLLGSATIAGVPDSALDAGELWLGVSVNNGGELTPRSRVGSTAHAIKTRSAEQLVRPNTFQMAVSVDAAGNVGVGTASPGSPLDVNGELRLTGAESGYVGLAPAAAAGSTTYTLPPSDGSAERVLATNGAGELNWTAGVPVGGCILTRQSSPPDGYAYTGHSLLFGSEGNGSWSTKASLPSSRYTHGAAAVNGKIYVISGYVQNVGGPGTLNEEYDPTTNTWTTKAPISIARAHTNATEAGNKIYVIGGAPTTGPAGTANEEYDPASNTWATKANMPTSRNDPAVAAWSGRLYVFGGGATNGPLFDVNERYDPATNLWVSLAPMPGGPRYQARAATVSDRIYVIGGYNGSQHAATHEAYDPALNSWTTLAPMSAGRASMAIGVINGKIYVAGGWPPTPPTGNAMEVYDPTTNAWTTLTSMPTPRQSPAGAVVNGKMYVIGGGGDVPWYGSANEEFTPPTPIAAYYLHMKQ